MNTIGNDESYNKKPDNEISDNEKSNNGNTADDYKDGAVTKNALQVITIIGEIEGHDNLNICFLSWRRLRWIKILKVYFLL